jgi:putative transposase
MRKSRFSAEQIAYCLSQAQAGVPIEELCRKYGVSLQTFYRWRAKFGALAPSELQRMKQMEDEIRRLKQIVADLSLDKQILQEALRKKA